MKASRVAWALLAAAAAAASLCESAGLAKFAFGGSDGSRLSISVRRAVGRFVPRGERVTFYRGDSAERPSQICRSLFLSMAWAAGAGNVGEKRSLDGDERYVVVSPLSFVPASLRENPRYREFRGPETGAIWIREDAPVALLEREDCGAPAEIRGAGIAAVARECWDWREAVSLAAPAALSLALLAFALRRIPSRGELLLCAAVCVPVAMFALSHSFTGPCGTGVFGGRAKALVESGWNIASLADSGMGEYFQAAYPPMQALVAAVGYAMSGVCGEWLVQLGPVMFLGAAFLAMASGCSGGFPARLLLAAACVTHPMAMAAGNFCAEPLMLLLVASGWRAVVRGDARGWFLVGLAAFVKNEGIFYAAAVAAAEAAARPSGRTAAEVREAAAALALGLLPAALWHFGCRWIGASLYDYAQPWRPDFARGLAALKAVALEAALHPWRYMFAPVAGSAWVSARACGANGGDGARSARAAAVFFAVCAGGACCAFSLSRAPDFAWHLSCMPRLLAPAAALALARALAPMSRQTE